MIRVIPFESTRQNVQIYSLCIMVRSIIVCYRRENQPPFIRETGFYFSGGGFIKRLSALTNGIQNFTFNNYSSGSSQKLSAACNIFSGTCSPAA